MSCSLLISGMSEDPKTSPPPALFVGAMAMGRVAQRPGSSVERESGNWQAAPDACICHAFFSLAEVQ